jgi:putative exosortase-associated protein (TIGR04073 family)
MRSLIISTVVLALTIFSARADISLPKQDTLYDKLGRGFSNIAHSPGELADSYYTTLQQDGPTVAASKGVVQGTGRMLSDIGLGVLDIITGPLPIGPGTSYRSLKSPPHGSMVVVEYPPADLINNWY